MTYGIRGRFPQLVKDLGFWAKRVRTPCTIAASAVSAAPRCSHSCLVANYEPTTKSLDDSVSSMTGSAVEPEAEDVEKPSPSARSGAPSTRQADRPFIPAHKTYIELSRRCGGGAGRKRAERARGARRPRRRVSSYTGPSRG